MRATLTGRVREAAQGFRARGRTFTTGDIVEALDVMSYGTKKRVQNAVHELKKAGEIKSISAGVYTYAGKIQKPTKQKVMWNYFRMRMKCGEAVTAEELQGVAEASAEYVKEWLKFLVRNGYVKKLGNGKFQLLKDPVDMPSNEAKTARLQALRNDKKKEVMAILKEIQNMAQQAQEIVAELSE